MQCTNHLKQFGLAVHNFHDTRNGLPPSAIYTQKPSFWAIIYPYLEQTALYEAMHTIDVNATNKAPFVTNGTSDTNVGGWFKNALKTNNNITLQDTKPYRSAFGSVSFYKCPSRRSGVNFLDDENWFSLTQDGVNDANLGPRADYAVVSVFEPENMNQDYIGTNWFNSVSALGNGNGNSWLVGRNHSPFRPSLLQWASGAPATAGTAASDKKWITNWQPRESMAWWSDGTSNQLIVGEKFIPQEVLEKQGQWDGGNLNTNTTHQNLNVARGIWKGFTSIKRNPHEITGDDLWDSNGKDANVRHAVFGGIHPGTTNFLFGDGSVHAVSPTINWTTLYYLGKTDDGEAVQLP